MTRSAAFMRALMSEVCGGPETLAVRSVPVPDCGADEVLIHVAGCGINYPDLLMIEDRYQFVFERPFTPGIEVAGMVEAKGAGVDRFTVGDRVVAQVAFGGLAEKAVAKADRVYPLPAAVDEIDAAAMLLAYGTSYYALRDRAGLKAGETLLVLGAGGGVGLAAVQLGQLMGAYVVAAVSSSDKAEAARAAGADKVLVYVTEIDDPRALSAQFKAACGKGFDVIYDPVGGQYAEAAIRAIAWDGRYLVIGFPAGITNLPLNLILLRSCQVIGVFWGASINRDPQPARAMMSELLMLVAAKRLLPLPPSIFALEDAGHAIAALRDRTAVGKLVVSMCPAS